MKRTRSFTDLPNPESGSEGTPIPEMPSGPKRPYAVGMVIFEVTDEDAEDVPQDWDGVDNYDLMAHEHLADRHPIAGQDDDANDYLRHRSRNYRALIEASAAAAQ